MTGGFDMLLSIVAFSLAVTDAPSPRPVVIATDCGCSIDDQWAIVHLALSPEISLKGIVTTHASNLARPAAEAAAKSVREVLDQLEMAPKPAVIAGSSEPLGPERKARETAGSKFLIEAANGHAPERRLTIVMIGAATDVASALLVDPSWADRVEVVAMAFDDWSGGDPWNVKNDVIAWQVVMDSRVPLVVGDSAVCRRDLVMTVESARERFGSRGKPGAYLARTFAEWVGRNAKLAEDETTRPGAWPIWDEVAVAYVLGKTRQESRDRPTLREDRRLVPGPPGRTIVWITSVDSGRLWGDLLAKMR